jgi:hypothetical protein
MVHPKDQISDAKHAPLISITSGATAGKHTCPGQTCTRLTPIGCSGDIIPIDLAISHRRCSHFLRNILDSAGIEGNTKIGQFDVSRLGR